MISLPERAVSKPQASGRRGGGGGKGGKGGKGGGGGGIA